VSNKRCARCTETKDVAEFRKAANRPDGLYNYCRPCHSASAKASYERNRGKAIATVKAYRARPEIRAKRHDAAVVEYAANRELHLERAKGWAKANKARRRTYVRDWNDRNRALVRSYQMNHKARKRAAGRGAVSASAWRTLQQLFRGRCVYCGQPAKLEQDHVQPLSKGGEHAFHNVVPACRGCNATKQSNPAPAFWWTR
jgi:hypothetical protein